MCSQLVTFLQSVPLLRFPLLGTCAAKESTRRDPGSCCPAPPAGRTHTGILRQFPKERAFLPVSSPWGCPRRWFRVKQGGNALPALPQSGAFFGKNLIPIQAIPTRLFFIFSKTNKTKRSTPPSLPQTGARSNNCSGGHRGCTGLPPPPTRGFCLLSSSSGICHPIPSPVPASPGASPGHLPPHFCHLIFPLLHQSPAKPSHPKATLGTGPSFL